MYFRVFLCLDCFIVILLGGTGPVADLGASLIDEVVLRKHILFLARSEAGEDMPSGELIKQCVCVYKKKTRVIREEQPALGSVFERAFVQIE